MSNPPWYATMSREFLTVLAGIGYNVGAAATADLRIMTVLVSAEGMTIFVLTKTDRGKKFITHMVKKYDNMFINDDGNLVIDSTPAEVQRQMSTESVYHSAVEEA